MGIGTPSRTDRMTRGFAGPSSQPPTGPRTRNGGSLNGQPCCTILNALLTRNGGPSNGRPINGDGRRDGVFPIRGPPNGLSGDRGPFNGVRRDPFDNGDGRDPFSSGNGRDPFNGLTGNGANGRGRDPFGDGLNGIDSVDRFTDPFDGLNGNGDRVIPRQTPDRVSPMDQDSFNGADIRDIFDPRLLGPDPFDLNRMSPDGGIRSPVDRSPAMEREPFDVSGRITGSLGEPRGRDNIGRPRDRSSRGDGRPRDSSRSVGRLGRRDYPIYHDHRHLHLPHVHVHGYPRPHGPFGVFGGPGHFQGPYGPHIPPFIKR